VILAVIVHGVFGPSCVKATVPLIPEFPSSLIMQTANLVIFFSLKINLI
jgi:hypothetical protein